MKFEKKYISTGVKIIEGLVLLCAIRIIFFMFKPLTTDYDKWRKIADVSVVDSVTIAPNRGNILSADGQLMASSLPNYRVYLDYKASVSLADTTGKQQLARDSIFMSKLDTICDGLHDIFPDITAEEHKARLEKGLALHSRYWEIVPGRLYNYLQYQKLKKLPFFNNKRFGLTGLNPDPRNNRKKPFGTLARRTLGEMHVTKDYGQTGLENAYDSLLRGKEGIAQRKTVLNKFTTIQLVAPQDGYDLVSTIDVTMQDICESSLRNMMAEVEADMGVVVLMETKTGDVKAIVNLELDTLTNTYKEQRNNVLTALLEPGSTFKTASMLVALDDGVITVNDVVDTGGGVYDMHGAWMRDHNWNSTGGYGVIDVPHILMYSSNIGVSRIIDEHYRKQPEKFVEGLHRVGMGIDLGLPFVGVPKARIRMPNDPNQYWSKTTLPWMSIGYETQIPPIYTVTFYNAIANGGKMVRPRFVKGLELKGKLVEEFPVEVIKEKICSDHALKDIQGILQRVVCDKEGLGRKAGNPHFHVSGKTGTAQIAAGGRYNGVRSAHLVSFCGYFPSEDPRYTCLVAIRHNYHLASGGLQAGGVFNKISLGVYSKNITRPLTAIRRDSTVAYSPSVKKGDQHKALYVLNSLGAEASAPAVQEMDESKVPNVIGMGARDAIYEMERRGVKVRLHGRGKVKSQSIAAGESVGKGRTVVIELD